MNKCLKRVLGMVVSTVYVNAKGYYRINGGKYRKQYLHRAVWEIVAGKKLPDGWHVHHQDFDKTHCCPENLIAMPPELNPAGNCLCRCPYTGIYLTRQEYERRLGLDNRGVEMEEWL